VDSNAGALQARTNNGSLPLHVLCANKPTSEAIQFLVQSHRASVSAVNDDGDLPLHVLCANKPTSKAVQFLVQSAPGSVSVANNDGNLPVMMACSNQHASLDVINKLVRAHPESVDYMQRFFDPEQS
jgi:ankyrin repeat protein